jgi:HAD superfamily hydrolase (TIGR01509 family)
MIKNLLFDMGGVVFRQNTDEARRRFSAAGIDTARYMGDYGQKDFFLDLETGKIGPDEFCRQMAAAAGRQQVSLEEAQHCWLGFIRDVPAERLLALLTLRETYHVCLLTNTNPFVMDFTRSTRFSAGGKPITHYFDSLFCSYEMHVCKPDPAIFLQALAADGMKANESLFVDDSAKNVEAAEALGIRGLHVPTDEDWTAELTNKLNRLNR